MLGILLFTRALLEILLVLSFVLITQCWLADTALISVVHCCPSSAIIVGLQRVHFVSGCLHVLGPMFVTPHSYSTCINSHRAVFQYSAMATHVSDNGTHASLFRLTVELRFAYDAMQASSFERTTSRACPIAHNMAARAECGAGSASQPGFWLSHKQHDASMQDNSH